HIDALDARIHQELADVRAERAHGEGAGQTQRPLPLIARLDIEPAGLPRSEVERLDVDEIAALHRAVEHESSAEGREAIVAELDDLRRGQARDHAVQL